MQRKPVPRIYTVAFLVLSAALSVILLAVRNLYDDEISSLEVINLPFAAIAHVLTLSDVHPPGMYLLGHLAYRIFPSFRWLNLLPLVFFYGGLSFFVLRIAPTFRRTRAQLVFLLLATLHPQLLMWGNTYRWYSWWTALALILLVVALQPRIPQPRLTVGRAIGIGFLLAGLFYLNYITLLFAAALAAAMSFRYRSEPRRQKAISSLIVATIFALLIAPQLRTMITVHLPNIAGQQSSILLSFVRLLQSLAESEAFLPWHPLALCAVAIFVTLSMVAISRRAMIFSSGSTLDLGDDASLASILILGLTFFILIAASGLGGKPRNGLLLIPILATLAALADDLLTPRLQALLFIFLAVWSAFGTAHLLGRYGIAKASMNDHPEQVVAFIQRSVGNQCALVVTYDVELSFALSQSRLPGLILVAGGGAPILMRRLPEPANDCKGMRLFAISSYQGEPNFWTIALTDEFDRSTHLIQGAARTDRFSADPNAAAKRQLGHLFKSLPAATELPDYRYTVTSGDIDPHALPDLLKAMPDYIASSESTAWAAKP